MAGTLSNETWEVLLQAIDEDRCVPLLGAGACYGALPTAAELAKDLAEKYRFPLPNPENLAEVAEYVAVRYDPMYAKRRLLEQFAQAEPPDFAAPDEPHGVLADLPLSIYLTTNYDDFLVRALSRNAFRRPVREFCRWNDVLKDEPSALKPDFELHPAQPVVFHLHGHTLPESLVLTEGDYLRFLANMARDPELLPPVIRRALTRSACLFIGYRLADWNLRVLFEGLRTQLRLTSVAVLLPPGKTAQEQAKAQEYLDLYYRKVLDLQVYWGKARDFCAELRRRWTASTSANGGAGPKEKRPAPEAGPARGPKPRRKADRGDHPDRNG